MDVEVRCYGDVRAAVGERTLELALEPGSTVADLLETMAATTRYDPAAARDGRDLVVMRDRRHLDPDDVLEDGDTIGLSGDPMPE